MFNDLTKTEYELIARVESARGTMEEEEWIAQQGIFDAYCDVHREYTMRMPDPEYGMEALKRALFIQWYACVEPACFTGIKYVNQEMSNLVFDKLDTVLLGHISDPEIRTMLRVYYRICDLYFADAMNLRGVCHCIERGPRVSVLRFKCSQFVNRGAMGLYWPVFY